MFVESMRGQIQAVRVLVDAMRVLEEAVRELVVILFGYFDCSVKLHFSRKSVPLCSEYTEWALPRHSEIRGRSTFSEE